MNLNKITTLTPDLLDEYYTKKTRVTNLRSECNKMSIKIKELMEAEGVTLTERYGYSLEIEEKFDPSKELIDILIEKNLLHLLTITCSKARLNQIWEELGNPSLIQKEAYLVPKKTKWLHMKKVEEK